MKFTILPYAIVAVVLAALSVVAAANVIELDYAPYTAVFDEALVDYYAMYDSRPQSFWYKAYVALLILIALGLALLRPTTIGFDRVARPLEPINGLVQRGILGAAPYGARATVVSIGVGVVAFLSSYTGLIEADWPIQAGVLCLYIPVCFMLIAGPHSKAWVLAIAIVAFLALNTLPALDSRVFAYPNLPVLSSSDHHVTSLVGSAFQIDAGMGWFDDTIPRYGMIPALAVLLLREFAVEITYTTLPYIAATYQMVGTILALLLVAYRANEDAPDVADRTKFALFCMVLFFFVVGPSNISSYYAGIFFPNQSFMRHFPLLIFVLALCLLDRGASNRRAIVIGGLIGLTVLCSPELGFVSSMGTAFAWLVQQRRQGFTGTPLANFLYGLGGYLGSLAIFYAGYWVSLGEPMIDFAAYLEFILLFGKGFGGIKLGFDFYVALIVLHCSLIVAAACLSIRHGKHTPSPFEAGLALGILIWMLYYVNRPASWNLWSICLLYAFLLIPLFARHWRFSILPIIVIAVFFDLSSGPVRKSYEIFVQTARAETKIVDCKGVVRLPSEDCDKLAPALDELATLSAAHPDLLWMTHFPAISMMAINKIPPTQFIDQFVPNLSLTRQAAYTAEIKVLSPGTIAIDTVEDDARRTIYQRFATQAGYTLCPSDYSSWDIYRPEC